ncbi:hypothetical protein [Streptococcus mutans]|uniref:hypothetical protein n=1 Tax=Streptococcus mutans TaxID=1309 RepID=UPI0002B55BBC|nr:hypothetical protein [Streptococcus mutans]EMC59277.1 hypothetical protein SMU109_03780 [Streptococcus mutans OMZ175]MDT9554878.1 hypothetical protein [Streptococcus mutans]QZS44792.1 hypothetical protein K2F51_03150 [Streptococcus mutans OMZ175]
MTKKLQQKGNRCPVSLYIDPNDLNHFDTVARSLGDTRTALFRKLTKVFLANRSEFLEKFPELADDEMD